MVFFEIVYKSCVTKRSLLRAQKDYLTYNSHLYTELACCCHLDNPDASLDDKILEGNRQKIDRLDLK